MLFCATTNLGQGGGCSQRHLSAKASSSNRALLDRLPFEQRELLGMLPKPMPLGEEVLGPIGDALVASEDQGTLFACWDVGRLFGLQSSIFVVLRILSMRPVWAESELLQLFN
ncbi:hypothetical protein FisN_2Lu389 [Fistulifera solaris]|uniref:Uncharacterized protein n=1 Tax=Fistulifera solaris TaxID=1519565 RepID=A0A1Z5JPF0_FISSO|nr:hypothetical protein FisN_2Lu389 [Fistulifera solaris]|eukprot:GAX15900.1 hypothetical protein FisN_2Lu389 [Fistulifera solaris]